MCQSKAVSEMLRDYSEEHPEDAKTIVQKVNFWLRKPTCNSRRLGKWYKENRYEYWWIT